MATTVCSYCTVAWPPLGPDVTGGQEMDGHAHKIPAQLCYDNTPRTAGILTFNASSCYGGVPAR